MFDLTQQIFEEIKKFDTDKIRIASVNPEMNDLNILSKDNTGYLFSQKETLQKIEMYDNDQFWGMNKGKKGEQQRLFFNIIRAVKEVFRMRTDIDLKNYIFIPTDSGSIEKVSYIAKEFREWSKDKGFGQEINDLGDDYSKFGTVVGKRVKGEIKRVPIMTLKNTQTGKSLREIMETGGFVTECHEYTYHEMTDFKAWDLTKIEYKKEEPYCKYPIYERYGLVPENEFNRLKGISGGSENNMTLAMAIVCEQATKNNKKDGKILFIEKTTCPYEECHIEKIDGRWLGKGPIETNFNNQTARNVVENLRIKNLTWAAKKIFASNTDDTPKNLTKEVPDGAVIAVGPNGTITQVNMATQHTADFQGASESWADNTRQKTFQFEVATGESMPSGTPFRLGVILSQAADTFYSKKRENFDFFLQRIFFNQTIPIFKKENKAKHPIRFAQSDEDFEDMKELFVKHYTDREILKSVFEKGEVPDKMGIEEAVRQQLGGKGYLMGEVPEGFYDDVKAKVELVITGEQVDLQSQSETIKSILQIYQQDPTVFTDPVKKRILSKLMSKIGFNLNEIVGKIEANPQAMMPQMAMGNTPMGNFGMPTKGSV